MATLKAYPNGGSVGLAGGRRPCRRDARLGFLDDGCCRTYGCLCRKRDRSLCCQHAPAKRGNVTCWSGGSVRRHKAWLYSVNVDGLDGDGYGVTLTLRDTPTSHVEWKQLVERLCRTLRESGLSRWHWVVEWQRRGTPHLHLAVYAPPGWESPISNNVGAWTVRVWLDLAAAYAPGDDGQHVVPITGPLGWLEYLSKHASRGVAHYQRRGAPAGWTATGRLWGYGGKWPTVEPLVLVITDVQMRQIRRFIRAYVLADARATYLAESERHNCSGCARAHRLRKHWCRTCVALSRWQWSRRMLRCNDRSLSAVRGMSEWVPGPVLIRFAELAGWSGELKAMDEA